MNANHLCDTERLSVYRTSFDAPNGDTYQLIFGYPLSDDPPRIVVSATIGIPIQYDDGTHRRMVWWLNTNDQDRRQGYATELLKAIEANLDGTLTVDGATDAGDAFEAAWKGSP